MPASASPARPPRILVVGAGAIGGVVAAGLSAAGHEVVTLTTNTAIRRAIQEHGFRAAGLARAAKVSAATVIAEIGPHTGAFDYVLLATQPPQVEEAARSVLSVLSPEGRLVCFQNGLCEERIARLAGRERVVGAVIAWGASMIEPGYYDRTSDGGFTLGRLDGAPDDRVRELAGLLEAVAPVRTTDNLLGARWSKLAINCAISTLGTIGGDRVGPLLRYGFARRLALEIMTETAQVALSLAVRLEKVAGTVDLEWLSLAPRERASRGSPSLAAKHAVLMAAGFRYRRLRSSMLAAIERGRPPAVDFLNGEVVERGTARGIPTKVNEAARRKVWEIARGPARPSHALVRALYEETR